MSINTNTLACAYPINDKEAFTTAPERIIENFKKLRNESWITTAIILGHEIHRIELLEEAHKQKRYDLLDEIFGLVGPANIEKISDLSGY